ncbi:MAG: hypothetical protein WAS21_10430 [Geminicoccaceae bacterium]
MNSDLFQAPAPVVAQPATVTKTELAHRLACSKSNITKLTAANGPLAPAVRADGRIDLPLALRLYAARTNPAKRRADLLAAASPSMAGSVLVPAMGSATASDGESYASSKARAALVAAETAEINLRKLKDELVDFSVAKDAAARYGAVVVELLAGLGEDAVRELRGAATSEDARRAWRRLQTRIQAEALERHAAIYREALADA